MIQSPLSKRETVFGSSRPRPHVKWEAGLLLLITFVSLGVAFLIIRHFATLSRQRSAAEGPGLGEPVPEVTWAALSGGEIRKGDLNVQDTLLVFFKVDCSPCRASLPEVEKLHLDTIKTGFRVLLVSESDSDRTNELVHQLQISAPVFLDRLGSMKHDFHLYHTPAALWYQNGLLCKKGIGSKAVTDLGADIRRKLFGGSTVASR